MLVMLMEIITKTEPVRNYHWSAGPSAIRFLFDILRSRRFVRDCGRLGIGGGRYIRTYIRSWVLVVRN